MTDKNKLLQELTAEELAIELKLRQNQVVEADRQTRLADPFVSKVREAFKVKSTEVETFNFCGTLARFQEAKALGITERLDLDYEFNGDGNDAIKYLESFLAHGAKAELNGRAYFTDYGDFDEKEVLHIEVHTVYVHWPEGGSVPKALLEKISQDASRESYIFLGKDGGGFSSGSDW